MAMQFIVRLELAIIDFDIEYLMSIACSLFMYITIAYSR